MRAFFILLLCTTSLHALELRPFENDGCTLFFDGIKNKDWSSCCLKHDIDYYFGGTKTRRKQADQEFKFCVKESAGKLWAFLLHSGVIAGHLSPIKSNQAWNAFWNKSREEFIDSFTNEELNLIQNRMEESGLDFNIWNPLFIRLKKREY